MGFRKLANSGQWRTSRRYLEHVGELSYPQDISVIDYQRILVYMCTTSYETRRRVGGPAGPDSYPINMSQVV